MIFKKKKKIRYFIYSILVNLNQTRDNTSLGNLLQRFEDSRRGEELIGNASKFDKVLDQETCPQ